MIDSFSGKYRFLSNFWPCEIEYEGIKYPSTEHAFQAAKTLDIEERKRIAQLDTPGKAKRAGKSVELRSDWESIKIGVMREILQLKFADKKLAQQLLDTGDEELVEGNTWGDKFWGVCDGEGQNYLGLLLMDVRTELYDNNGSIV